MIATNGALLTDLYQLTMLEGYYRRDMNETAVFEWFVRELPRERGFLIAAGVEEALNYLAALRFTPAELAWLHDCGRFDKGFLNWLEDFRFEGDVHALAEGTVFFANEPVLRVTAPLPQAQLVESRLINLLHYQILVASKAARCVLTAPGKTLVDFGMRRAHGAEAAALAARASYLAGFAGSATVTAGALYHIPVYGTMAHSFVQAHESEVEAFAHFARTQPNNVVLLIDTYDTEVAAEKVASLAPTLAQEGIRIKAVRLDSGDLEAHSRAVREILDRNQLEDVEIFASGDIDEYALRRLTAAEAPIDGFGVGTKLTTSADAPFLNCAYKMQEYAGKPRRKRSEGKASWPGRKQVFRLYQPDGTMTEDVVGLESEEHPGHAMLVKVMTEGQRLLPPKSLADMREHTRSQLETLPPRLASLGENFAYPVRISETLHLLASRLDTDPH